MRRDPAELRRELYRASESRATSGEHANPPLIAKILELRREQASSIIVPGAAPPGGGAGGPGGRILR